MSVTPVPRPNIAVDVEATATSLSFRIRSEPPRQLLYHYTSGRGLMGIIENRELWATHIYFLNDHNEYISTFNAIKGLLPRRTVIRELLPSVPNLQDAVEKISPLERGRTPCIFVACFSEIGDDLSQWRGYTKPGDGYSIGFDPERLKALASAAGYRLEKVEYGEEGINTPEFRLIPLLQDLFTKYAETGPDTPERAREAAEAARFEIQQFAPLVKDWAFHGENEWRLISPLYDYRTTQFQFREGASFLVPYVKFDLGTLDRELIPSIVTGPGPNIELAAQAATIYAKQHGIDIHSRQSEASYRPW